VERRDTGFGAGETKSEGKVLQKEVGGVEKG